MHLVHEQYCPFSVEVPSFLGLLYGIPYLLDTGEDCIYGDEIAAGGVGYYAGQGGFSCSWRTVEYEGGELVCLYCTAKEPSFAHNMLLPEKVIQSFGPHGIGKRTYAVFSFLKQFHQPSITFLS